ncbi:MAG: TIGR01777 family oxidoreductase [Alicyclobacillus mali]|uniref:TIGR01777 family oxidoreductase n=1 Tax=Alicyclobacillus mali (ex Roth et al. 2021) TaxID=1123961 RepID=UPI0023F03E39|nr:TIGR01777 family oxidoreductase [Alicyclobacillus mali (ex Roth et al. 2021)]MCL6488846.1 TIGR01777 family oxidoreductase [Alicyclobacillus mali (ex Roth et al. 2021)]
MRIYLLGGSGFVGRHVTQELERQGHVADVVRRPYTPDALRAHFAKSIERGEPYAICNLAGASLNQKRWSAAYRREIVRSRVDTVRGVIAAIDDLPAKPAAYVQASAVGYYGPSLTETFTEASPPGSDFLSRVCVAWEQAAEPLRALTRVAFLRFGMVLGRDGGALPLMWPVFQMGLGGTLGRGNQWISWIHADDAARLAAWVLADDRLDGAFNATAPQPVQMRDFTRTLAEVLHRPHLTRVPGAALRLALGQRASLILEGQRVLPHRALDLGFSFAFPTLERAIRDFL